ncbi:sensor histidine kinase [Paenibacillus sp. CC-CFT747]|nr:sensor histidine kinase [Paenibacillus sp. CC-CFT747]
MFQNSIRSKLIVFLLAATLIPITISILITYLYTRETVSKETVATSSHLLYQGRTNIGNYLERMNQSSLSVYNDFELFDILDHSWLQSDELILTSRNEIYRALQTMAHSSREIRQVYLFLEKNRWSFAVLNENFVPFRKADYSMPQQSREVYLQAPHPLHSYGLSPNIEIPKQKVITLYRTIYNAISAERLGTLAIDFDLEALRQICGQLYEKGREELYLLDDQGTVLYSHDSSQEGQVLRPDWEQKIEQADAPSGSFDIRSRDFSGMVIYEKMQAPDFHWTLVKRIPYDYLNRSARQLTQINTYVFVLFLVVAVAFTILISFRFTAPIRRLTAYMNRIKTGQLQVDIDIQGTDEIARMGQSFRTMMETINNLILREYRLEIANKTNELKALQAQINPHFLNNALQSIGTLALHNGDRKMYSLIHSLAKMMRYSMNTSDSVVTLAQEIDYVKAYLDLQQQRFGEDLQVSFEVEREALKARLPKMILQPLVENYFKHGFPSPVPGKKIGIRCGIREGSRLRIEVTDNGPGMTPEELEAWNERLGRALGRANPPDSIGLINVNSRLQLFFGEGAGMRLTEAAGGGLGIELKFP